MPRGAEERLVSENHTSLRAGVLSPAEAFSIGVERGVYDERNAVLTYLRAKLQSVASERPEPSSAASASGSAGAIPDLLASLILEVRSEAHAIYRAE